ncbi:MAG: glycosyltransferase family 9 protein [Deltaproteobacteria bacterium]|nr:glycosyltransferase family 9 protein [Deltaproteobacteria bacterium]
MRLRRMIFIDQAVGTILCTMLSLFHWFKRRLFPARPRKVSSIAVLKFFGMGSIILCTPLLDAIRKKYPDARIYFITFAINEPLLRCAEPVDEIVTVRSDNFLTFARDVIVRLLHLRRRGVDMVFDLEFFARFSMIFSYLTGAPYRVGYYTKTFWRGNLLTHPTYFNAYKHITEVFMALGESVGAEPVELPLKPRLRIDPVHRERIRSLLSQSGLDGDKPLIVVNVNASDRCLEGRWPPDRFAGLMDHMVEELAIRPVLTGAGEEEEYVQHVLSIMKNPEQTISLAGKLDFYGLAGLLAEAHLVITNDTGPLHLSAVMDTPVMAFYGPDTPVRYAPLVDNRKVFFADLYCSPCLNVYNAKMSECRGINICMKAIELEEVKEALRQFLANGRF